MFETENGIWDLVGGQMWIILAFGIKIQFFTKKPFTPFKIGGTQAERNQSFVGQQGYFSLIDVTLHLRRRTLFFTFNFIMPSFIITMLNIAGFFLPPECGEKIALRK